MEQNVAEGEFSRDANEVETRVGSLTGTHHYSPASESVVARMLAQVRKPELTIYGESVRQVSATRILDTT